MVDKDNGFGGGEWGGAFISVLEHSAMDDSAKEPGRVMFNLETAQAKEESERIKPLGGAVIKAPYAMAEGWIATLADPDGNYSQWVSSRR